MAIIGKIRKHSGLVVIIVGVAIAAFVIGDFSKRRSHGTNNIGTVNGENISYREFNEKVEKNIEMQKENTGNEKMTDQETYQIRQSTWTTSVREILMGEEYEELGLTVSPEELFDQVQGKQPHRYILQYFKDPATGQYSPSLVLNYLKNLDKMEPKAKNQWLQFEKAIKEDRQETKFNNLIAKAYYVPKAFLKRDYIDQQKAIKVLSVCPPVISISDSAVKLTDADYEKFYEKNKHYFYQEEAMRDLDFVLFEVKPSDNDRKKIYEDVQALYKDFEGSQNPLAFVNANSDSRLDTSFVKKGTFPAELDTLLFYAKPGTIFPPFELNNAWYMAKMIDLQERPDSMKGSQILLAYAGTGNENIKRTKAEAKAKIDSLLAVLKKNPANFTEAAKKYSDYPTAKDDGGDLKWFRDGNPNFDPFFQAGLTLKPNEMKVVETRIGYSLFMLTEKSAPSKKVKAAVLTRSVVPSNQTFQDTYIQASTFAGQNKTPEAFDKAATAKGLQKRSAPNVREMDNYVMGLPSAREMVRWAYAENTKIGEVSPVFDLQGKYAIAVLKSINKKGQQELADIKTRIEPSVRNMKKIDMMAEKMQKVLATTKDITALADKLTAKVDTSLVTFAGTTRSTISRETELVGKIFTAKQGDLLGPLVGLFGAYFIYISEVPEVPQKDDFSYEKMIATQNFSQRVGSIYSAIEKTADIKDSRLMFY
ncbi:MAG TPA: SurA N-terminal domain-containing protein [Bacteroidales bacterium]|nr:SurA N-terminal domain-containing protein [Bacteroidales bacterium]